jgi:hypothetical protein
MFVQSDKFFEAHASKSGDISICGQESSFINVAPA